MASIKTINHFLLGQSIVCLFGSKLKNFLNEIRVNDQLMPIFNIGFLRIQPESIEILKSIHYMDIQKILGNMMNNLTINKEVEGEFGEKIIFKNKDFLISLEILKAKEITIPKRIMILKAEKKPGLLGKLKECFL